MRHAAASPLLVSKLAPSRARCTAALLPPILRPSVLSPDFDTLVDMHLVTRQSFGDRPLFGTKRGGEWQWLSYKDFGKKVDRCRAALASLGVRRGDTIASISNNREEWAVCAYATYSLGAAYVPMYEEQRPKDWRYILEDAGARVLFVSKAAIHRQTFHFAGVLGNLQHVFCYEAPESEPHSFEALLARAAPGGGAPEVPAFLPHPDELATVIYTSGTTGQPKGVMLSHRNLISNITGLRAILPEDLISCHDRSLSFLPWAHCYGQTAELHAFMAHGAALGIAEGVDKLLANLSEVKPTVLFAVPTVFKKAYDAIHTKVHEGSGLVRWLFARSLQASHHRRVHVEREQPVGRLLAMEHAVLDRLVLSKIRDRFGGNLKVSFVGGAATPLEVLSFFENIGIKICEGYGLTETSPLVTVNTPEAKYRRLGSTGRCLGDVDVKIVMEGAEMAPGQDGEVCVAGPNVMVGYRNLPEATREVFFEMGGRRYFRTGDLGRMEDGIYLRITGRIKEQYKLENGKYVVPGPIEAKLGSSRYITRALLFGQDRPFNVALLEPDWALLRQWAASKTDLPADATKGQLESHEAVQHLIEGEVQAALEGVKKYEVPRRWALLHDSLQERGMLTPKMSVKRHVVLKEYNDLIRHLYGEARQEQQQHEEPLPRAAVA
ncbi:unnamed protein product [Phaeothamnion confervicola]